jgi:hypothetical protein
MAVEDFTPTPEEVAVHMRARLKDSFGSKNEDGEPLENFSADTKPTLKQVEAMILRGVRKVSSKIGVAICEGGDTDKQVALYEDAKDLAALGIALVAERSYYPEQVGTEQSPYKAMLDEYRESAKTLVEAIAEHCGGGGGDSVGGGGVLPRSNFPCPSGIGQEIW